MKTKSIFLICFLIFGINIYANDFNSGKSKIDSIYNHAELTKAVYEENTKNTKPEIFNMILTAQNLEDNYFAVFDSFQNKKNDLNAEKELKQLTDKYKDSIFAALNINADSVKEFSKNLLEVEKYLSKDVSKSNVPAAVYELMINKIVPSMCTYLNVFRLNYLTCLKKLGINSCVQGNKE
jgi:hypothetical protein